MARFFLVLYFFVWGLVLSPFAAAQDKPADAALLERFDMAMEWAAENELEAVAASRLYVLTAISLFDSWHLSQGADGYIVKLSDLESFGVEPFDRQTLFEDVAKDFARCLLTDIESSPCTGVEPSINPARRVYAQILNHLPSPKQIEDEKNIPTKHSVHPEWRRAKPLELSSAQMYRPKGPPPEDSPAFEQALSEVKRLGEDVSELRLADESLSAAFWGNPAGTITPPGHWNDIALSMIGALSIEDQLDIILALNIALYDAGIAAWDSKHHLLYPRPDEMIRRLDPENPNWTAMGDVPLHPEYVSGHSAFSGAASTVLIEALGERAFCNTSKAMWGLARCFESFTAAAEEAGQSRIFGGLHYQFSNQDGLELGRRVGRHTLMRLQDKGVLNG